jgi:uncharacterized protein (TIGR03000 family)
VVLGSTTGQTVYYPAGQPVVTQPVASQPVVSQPVVTVSNTAVSPTKSSPAVSTTPKIHALLAFDTRDRQIGTVLRKDVQDVKEWFTAQLDPSQIAGEEPKMLFGASATAEEVVEFCKSVEPGPNDTVLVYIGSHGEKYNDDDHAIILGNKRLVRSRLLSMLQAKSPRLVVLITDTCFGGMPVSGRVVGVAPNRPPQAPKYKRLMEDLFVYPRGVVNINSCAPGELAWNDRSGGLMTQALIAVFQRGRQGFGKENERVTWQEMFDEIQTELDERFATLKKTFDLADPAAVALEKQENQTLYQFTSLPGAVASRGPAAKTTTPVAPPVATPSPAPAAKPSGSASAFLEIEVPDGASISLDGKPIPSTGSRQVFVKLSLPPGKAVTYTLTAERRVNGGRQTVAQFVDVTAGETTRVAVEFPTTR